MKRLVRHAISVLTFAVLAACGGGSAPPATDVQLLATSARDATAASLRVDGGATHAVIDPRLQHARGPQRVWVTLTEPSLAAAR